MPNTQPLRLGDSLMLRHQGGTTQEVEFRGMYGTKFNQPYIAWPMAGEYKVDLSTGKLLAKRVSMWRVVDGDLKRLREASRAAVDDYNERRKVTK